MKKLFLPLFMALMFTACASSQVKDPAKVESGTTSATGKEPSTQENKTPTATSPVAETPVEGNPLKDPNNILSKRSVYFDFDKYEVKPEFKSLLEAHAQYLIAHPESSIRIEGNADDRGSREYNLSLGQKRAVAVKSAVNILGVPDKQIETISYGEEKPKAIGEDEASWAENRRADIVYSGE